MPKRDPKILIVYDWLNTKDGGGEQVLYEILDLYPTADVSVLIYNKAKFQSKIGDRAVKTSYLNYFPGFMKRHPELLLPFIKRAVERIDTKGYDQVIAISSAWVKNVRLHGSTRMLVYCFSPARMLWDYWPRAMTERTNNPIIKFFVTMIASKLRVWDYMTSQDPRRKFVAISKLVARRIRKFYHREANVIYPPVTIPPDQPVEKGRDYVMISVLAPYKQIDIAIKAFAGTKRSLIIAGDGPDRERLHALAERHTNVRLLGRVSRADKIRLLRSARAFIFTSIEDFGIAPVEAMACSTPVIALRGGGVSETVIEPTTGLFFNVPTVEALREALDRAEAMSWSPQTIRRRALRYSQSHFCEAFIAEFDSL
ncbi:glycosyltransferase [Candidatus Saccharibacteria bacterium]|nr:glycosyltransferase [Candidatus Saccharibacteria bacterium]